MANVQREEISTLHDKITVKLAKEDYLPRFEDDIKSYRKRANIPGFRKGMVPAGVIKKMFGKELYADAVLKTAENELQDYLTNEKLDIFGQPIFLNSQDDMPKLDVRQPEEYQFLFEIGIQPEIQNVLPGNISATLYKVEVKPEDIDKRIDGFQSQYGKLNDADSVESPENVLYVSIREIDQDGNDVEDGVSQDTSMYVKIFTEAYQQQLMGKKKDDTLEGSLKEMVDPAEYPGIYQNLNLDPENPEQADKRVRITISSVKDLEKKLLGEELYKSAFPAKNISTEDEFRSAVEEDEQDYWNQTANHHLEHELYHLITESPMTLPEDFLKKWLNNSGKEPLSEEDLAKELPTFIEQLKWSLITGKIIKDQDLKVAPEEVKQEIKDELARYFGASNMDLTSDSEWIEGYINQMMQDTKQTNQRTEKIMAKKVFDWIKANVPTTEKEITQEDFKKLLEESEHHHHHH